MCQYRNKKKKINLESSNLPKDVIKAINSYFPDLNDANLVLDFLEKKSRMTLNVGESQLVRALLLLIDGDLQNLKRYEVISDPRDIIYIANKRTNNRFNYFNDPLEFNETEK